mmetsp:Transcript_5930/g.26231  ORF Transcript_5930/g.26231 Transcript_5930/m.26231 type:complete len:245 (-) Transcript_5930:309-1043(-)
MTQRVLHELPDVRGSFQIVRYHRRPPRGSRIKRKLARVCLPVADAAVVRPHRPRLVPAAHHPARRSEPVDVVLQEDAVAAVAAAVAGGSHGGSHGGSGGVWIPPRVRLGVVARRQLSAEDVAEVRVVHGVVPAVADRHGGWGARLRDRLEFARAVGPLGRQVLAKVPNHGSVHGRDGLEGEDLAADAPFRGVHSEQADVTADVDHGVPRAERYPVAHVAVLLEYLPVEELDVRRGDVVDGHPVG